MNPKPIASNGWRYEDTTTNTSIGQQRAVTMSVSFPARQAMRTGLWLVWTVIRHPRTPVTFEMGHDR